MRFWKRLTAARDDAQPLPAEIYISLVDALFKDSRSLFVGSLAASITALITAWKTGEQALYLAAEPKLRAAANESALVAKADENTTQMLTKFLGALGFDTVHVAFQDNPA